MSSTGPPSLSCLGVPAPAAKGMVGGALGLEATVSALSWHRHSGRLIEFGTRAKLHSTSVRMADYRTVRREAQDSKARLSAFTSSILPTRRRYAHGHLTSPNCPSGSRKASGVCKLQGGINRKR